MPANLLLILLFLSLFFLKKPETQYSQGIKGGRRKKREDKQKIAAWQQYSSEPLYFQRIVKKKRKKKWISGSSPVLFPQPAKNV